jgi:hypothetical protein
MNARLEPQPSGNKKAAPEGGLDVVTRKSRDVIYEPFGLVISA